MTLMLYLIESDNMSEDRYFTPLFYKLQQEGFITGSCISTGLTELRNADIGDKGRYYTGFFQLSIGIERISKLAIIMDYMIDNNLMPPGEKKVRGYGHGICDLYGIAGDIAARRKYKVGLGFDLDGVRSDMLKFLDEFARGVRYANLDALAKGSSEVDPLAKWNDILMSILDSDVSKSKIRDILHSSSVMAKRMQGSAVVHMHDLDNEPLTLETWMSKPALHREASKYVIWNMALVIEPLIELVSSLSNSAMSVDQESGRRKSSIPYMYEFYSFLWMNKRHLMRKKRWRLHA